jgi:hypothetical protein
MCRRSVAMSPGTRGRDDTPTRRTHPREVVRSSKGGHLSDHRRRWAMPSVFFRLHIAYPEQVMDISATKTRGWAAQVPGGTDRRIS